MTVPRTITRRVAEYPCDAAARELARLAWPSEADDHQERWCLRLVFEDGIRNRTAANAIARCVTAEEREHVHDLVRQITDEQ